MSHFLVTCLFFIAGATIGSFCGVLIEEPNKKRSLWTGRSMCQSCKRPLRWFELIPIISWCLQSGRCRSCHKKIPLSVIAIELIMALLWPIFGSLLMMSDFTLFEIFLHLIVVSMLVMLAVIDAKNMTLPDRLTLPMLVIVGLLLGANHVWGFMSLFASGKGIFLGAFLGMLFYLLQMMIPASLSAIKKNRWQALVDILLMPFITPLWLIVKIFAGEKVADHIFPSFSTIDRFPTWVGGGDIRLGILMGMIMGPWYLLWTIGIGYTGGSIMYIVSRIFTREKLTVLPVAPLLLFGACVTYIMSFYS